jgi:hypothetical protein
VLPVAPVALAEQIAASSDASHGGPTPSLVGIAMMTGTLVSIFVS